MRLSWLSRERIWSESSFLLPEAQLIWLLLSIKNLIFIT